MEKDINCKKCGLSFKIVNYAANNMCRKCYNAYYNILNRSDIINKTKYFYKNKKSKPKIPKETIEFIKKIDLWIGPIDSFLLTHHFLNVYKCLPTIFDKLSVEDQLSYMYQKLQKDIGYNN